MIRLLLCLVARRRRLPVRDARSPRTARASRSTRRWSPTSTATARTRPCACARPPASTRTARARRRARAATTSFARSSSRWRTRAPEATAASARSRCRARWSSSAIGRLIDADGDGQARELPSRSARAPRAARVQAKIVSFKPGADGCVAVRRTLFSYPRTDSIGPPAAAAGTFSTGSLQIKDFTKRFGGLELRTTRATRAATTPAAARPGSARATGASTGPATATARTARSSCACAARRAEPGPQSSSPSSRQTSTETSSTGSANGGSGLEALTETAWASKSLIRRSAIAAQRRSSVLSERCVATSAATSQTRA